MTGYLISMARGCAASNLYGMQGDLMSQPRLLVFESISDMEIYRVTHARTQRTATVTARVAKQHYSTLEGDVRVWHGNVYRMYHNGDCTWYNRKTRKWDGVPKNVRIKKELWIRKELTD